MRIISLFLIALLWSCTTVPNKPDPLSLQADHLMAQGQYERAARLYMQLSQKNRSDQYRLKAAQAWFKAGHWKESQNQLALIDPEKLGKAVFQYRLLQAELALKNNQPKQVLKQIAALPAQSSLADKKAYYRLRAEAFKRLGRIQDRIESLIALDSLLEDESEHLNIQLTLLKYLTQQKIKLKETPLNKGWQELAILLNNFPNDPHGVIGAYREWRALYPQIPVATQLLRQYYRQSHRALPDQLKTIAVLLPLSGRYAPAARLIQQGLIQAWFADDPSQRPALKFYDSSKTDQVWPLLNRAVKAGADMIIGPLKKEAVLQLAQSGGLPVPVLALNQVNVLNPPAGLFQYALSPEDEAAQAAIWAKQKGWQRAALLYDQSKLSQRAAKAFKEAWAEEDGQLISQIYQLNAQLSSTVKSIADQKDQLDFVLVLGDQNAVRQIRPLLQFHYAGQLPVLSTSRIWNGHLERAALLDLKGVIIDDMPWLIDQNSDQALSYARLTAALSADHSLIRLLPMGVDAYFILPRLKRLAEDPWQSYSGLTGELYMVRQIIKRRLTWIQLDQPIKILGITPMH